MIKGTGHNDALHLHNILVFTEHVPIHSQLLVSQPCEVETIVFLFCIRILPI